ncbi:signal peptidase II [bacterium]|nr:signal peptidase II [bacterium]
MSKASKYIYFVFCYVFFIFVNIYTSSIVVENITNGLKIDNPVFSLNYVKNTGAAFSILKDAGEFLIILAVIALVLLILYVIKHIKKISLKECFFIALLSGGIAGNLHERIVFGYVRDYFQLNFVNFPVFNISDIFINIGVIALIILIIIKRTK